MTEADAGVGNCSAILTVHLSNKLLEPADCVFDVGNAFQAICRVVEGPGSTVTVSSLSGMSCDN